VRWLVLVGVVIGTKAHAGRHTMVRGETLEHVARAHGCSVASVLRANNLDNVLVPAGTVVRVPTCTRGRPQPQPVTDDDRARRALAVIDGTGITRPVELVHAPPPTVIAPIGASRSIGAPWDGRLHNARELLPGEGYTIRRPANAYGADHVVEHVRRAIAEVRAQLPHVHTLAIGDLSDRDGGPLERHQSHQSGLDVDIGLYFKATPGKYPREFADASKDLDLEAMWTLVVAFARTAELSTGVQVIFLDHHIQARLYRHAKARGISDDELSTILQYPRDKTKLVGLVRHYRNHYDHLHVRFKSFQPARLSQTSDR
jgi:murein endopeptidase